MYTSNIQKWKPYFIVGDLYEESNLLQVTLSNSNFFIIKLVMHKNVKSSICLTVYFAKYHQQYN